MYTSVEYLARLIKSLFANNEQGFAYDPNDLTTLYQDAAGTIPVTGAGQPVGLVLDKSKGLVLGINTNVMSQWGSTIGFTYTAPNLILSNTSGGTQYPQRPILAVGKWYKVQVTCSSAVGNIKFSNQGGSTQSPVLTVGTITAYILAADANLVWSLPNNSSATITAFTAQELAGNHAYQTVSASRPILQRNATTGAYYLAFDGVDDFLQTNNIDFTATDAISLFTAVSISNFKFSPVCELSSDPNLNNGTFALSFDNGATMRSRGTSLLRDAAAVLATRVTTVLSGKASISNDSSLLRKNAIQVALNSNDQGAGNYGNYPLFIARRGGVSPPFDGDIYSLIGISRLTTDAETLALEKAIAKATGVTLNV